MPAYLRRRKHKLTGEGGELHGDLCAFPVPHLLIFRVRGLEIAVDFTAPALLALLSLLLAPRALLMTVLACVLHESAHFLAMLLTRCKPLRLTVSAVGFRLTLQGSALCPMPVFCAVMLAGAGANLVAAAVFALAGLPDAAAANLAPALLNLLPFHSTDGGTLLSAVLEHFWLIRRPALPRRMMRLLSAGTAAALGIGMIACGITNPSLWGMLLFMSASELLCG